MIVLGRVALSFALVFSLASIVFIAMGVRQRSFEMVRNGYYAVYGLFLSSAIAFAVLLQAFINKDFGFAYVADYSDAKLSIFYRVAGLWAGQQGSFLLWLFFLAAVVAIIALRNLNEIDDLTAVAVAVLSGVSVVFSVLMLLDEGSKPFVAALAGVEPTGLNPLLLHPAMVLHPPTLFMGYVGLAVPFAFAIAALVLRRSGSDWVKATRKWTEFGWLFLSLGIGLGAWWAYTVLGWGGYWGWDPVENTSFIPWLTATALLHASTLYVKRGIFKRWALSLAIATFWLTILATWVTRTGVISSVHAFERNNVMIWVLSGFLIAAAVGGVALIISRWRDFSVTHETNPEIVSRDFLYFLTNLLLSLFAAVIVFATVLVPLLTGNKRTVGPEVYNKFAQPLGVIVLLLIAVCPLLSWKHTDGSTLWKRLRWPLVAVAVAAPALALTGRWLHSIGGYLGMLVCVFAAVCVLEFIVYAAQRASRGANFFVGLWRALKASRSRTGGWVAHVGMVLIMFGLLGSNVYKLSDAVTLKAEPGQTVTQGDYTLRFVRWDNKPGPQDSQQDIIVLDVLRGDKKVGQVKPRWETYKTIDPATGKPQEGARASILGLVGADVFVAPNSYSPKTGDLGVMLDVFPLVRLVWFGSILLIVGSTVSLWPKYRPLAVVTEDADEDDETAAAEADAE